MSVITHLVDEMYEHLDTLNGDIDRLTVMRDRMKTAILALVPPGDSLSVESPRPGVKAPYETSGDTGRIIREPKVTPSPSPAKAAPISKPKAQRQSAGRPRPAKYDLAAVAEVAMAAYVDGRPMGKAVGAVLDVTEAMGGWLIRQARDAGHPIPKRTSSAANVSGHGAAITAMPVSAEPWTADRARDALESGAA